MLSDTKNKELLTRSEGLVALRDAYVFEFLDSAGHPHQIHQDPLGGTGSYEGRFGNQDRQRKNRQAQNQPGVRYLLVHKFRKLDVRQQSHRKMLIDAFVNAIYLYDDKLVLTLNYKDGTKTITLDDVKEAVKNNTGSDLDCRGAPITGIPWWGIPVVMSWSGLEPI